MSFAPWRMALCSAPGRFGAKGGRHVRYPKGTPMTNLFLSMLDITGVRAEKLGDSNGKLDCLSL